MSQHGFGDLVADTHHGIECGHRFLEYHGYAGASYAPHLCFGSPQQLLSSKGNVAINQGLVWQEPQNRQRRYRFSGAGFSNQAHHFARGYLKAHIADRTHRGLSSREFHR